MPNSAKIRKEHVEELLSHDGLVPEEVLDLRANVENYCRRLTGTPPTKTTRAGWRRRASTRMRGTGTSRGGTTR